MKVNLHETSFWVSSLKTIICEAVGTGHWHLYRFVLSASSVLDHFFLNLQFFLDILPMHCFQCRGILLFTFHKVYSGLLDWEVVVTPSLFKEAGSYRHSIPCFGYKRLACTEDVFYSSCATQQFTQNYGNRVGSSAFLPCSDDLMAKEELHIVLWWF